MAMKDRDYAKLQARISALEVLMVEVLAYVHWAQDKRNPVASAEAHKKKFREMGSNLTLPGVPAVKADMAVGEISDAIDDLLALVVATLKTTLRA